MNQMSLLLSHVLLLSLAVFSSSQALPNGDMTPLQKHVSFFDKNKDGLIYPTETFQGLRAIGCSFVVATAGATFINGVLGPKTSDWKFPNPLLPIYVKNIQRGKHGSDTGVYDTQGRFVEANFEAIFTKHALTDPDALTEDEVNEMLQANKQPDDDSGSNGASIEWKLLFSLSKDQNGMLEKAAIKSVYDGSLFYNLAKAQAQKKVSLRSLYSTTV